MPRKKNLREVLAEFRKIHGTYYDYSSVEYVGSGSKVKIRCPVHGDFEITPEHHGKGVGCRSCYFQSQKISKEEFVSRAQRYFGDRYDYGHFGDLPRAGEKVPIVCQEHGELFWQEPRSHMRGHTGCPDCKWLKQAGPENGRGRFKSEEALKELFIVRAVSVHGGEYDYSCFSYVSADSKGKIICYQHGEFWQTPGNHLKGAKCPICSLERRKVDTFKAKCKALGVDYWRALKRREAGLSEEKIFEAGYVRTLRETSEITVLGVRYPNLEEAVRKLRPPASSATISRWLEEGIPMEEAFRRLPNPGYAEGIIYLATHKDSGKQYVGLTVQTLDRRWRSHEEQAFSGRIKGAESLHAAIREFGPDAFEIRQIDHGTTKKDLEAKERYWIEKLGALAPSGYNLSRGGVSGGSNKKPTFVDGIRFDSVGIAAEYVAETRGISVEAAKGRLRHNRIDAKSPAKPGESVVKTQVYKSWSRIIHGAMNPNSMAYVSGLDLYEPWRTFSIFYKDVGNPPREGMAFTRLDKGKGFFPANCVWLSKSESSRLNAKFMKEKGTLVGRRKTEDQGIK